jgi:uncharacterized protein YaaN involved in tellurite resistance
VTYVTKKWLQSGEWGVTSVTRKSEEEVGMMAEQVGWEEDKVVYKAQTEHTVKLAKLVTDYAQLYDHIDSINGEMKRKREELAAGEKTVDDLYKQLEGLAGEIRKQTAAG